LGAETPMSKTTVLLIDYEPASIEQMKAPLLAAGYNVEVVMDGVAGLKAFAELKPDLVLIEAMIPKKHGFEVCQEIKNTTDGKRTPVVIATSIYKGRKYRNQALQNYGCDEYLEKPVASEKLMEVCHKLLGDLGQAIDQVVMDETSRRPMEPTGGAATEATLQHELEAMTEDDISERLDEILGGSDESQSLAPDAAVSDLADMVDEIPAVEPVPEETTPEENILAEVAQIEAVPEEDTPVEVAPVAATPVDETSVEVSLVENAPEEEKPVEVAPAEETPVEATAHVAPLVEETPVLYEAEAVTVREPVATGSASSRSGIGIWIGLAAVILVAVGSFMFIRGMGGDTTPVVEQELPYTTMPVRVEAPGPLQAAGASEVAEEVIQLPVQPVLEVRKETAPADAPVKVDKEPAVEAVTMPVAEPVVVEVEQPALEVRKEALPVNAPVEVANEPVAKPVTEPVTEPAAISQPPDTPVSIPGESSDLFLESPVEVPFEPVAHVPFEPVAEIPLAEAPIVKTPVPQVAPVPVKVKRGDLVPLAEVDIKPVQTRNVQPRYDPMARERGQQGTVTLDLLIDEAGRVSEVNVVQEIPNSRLNNMAVLAARKWAYEPAIKDGVAVKVWKRVAIAFQL